MRSTRRLQKPIGQGAPLGGSSDREALQVLDSECRLLGLTLEERISTHAGCGSKNAPSRQKQHLFIYDYMAMQHDKPRHRLHSACGLVLYTHTSRVSPLHPSAPPCKLCRRHASSESHAYAKAMDDVKERFPRFVESLGL